MGYVEGANASNLQCLEYLSQDKCLSSLHKGLCSNPCVKVSVYKGSQWAIFVATVYASMGPLVRTHIRVYSITRKMKDSKPRKLDSCASWKTDMKLRCRFVMTAVDIIPINLNQNPQS